MYSTHFITGSIPKILAQDQTTESVSGDASFLITVRGLGFEVGMEIYFLLCEVKDVMTWCTTVLYTLLLTSIAVNPYSFGQS